MSQNNAPQAPDGVDGRARVLLSALSPAVDDGRFPIKRVLGESVDVEVDAFADGHDMLSVALLFKHRDEAEWSEVAMAPIGNDRFRGRLTVTTLGVWHYTVVGWIDRFATWRRDIQKKAAAGQDVHVDLLGGADLVRRAADRASGEEAIRLRKTAEVLASEGRQPDRVAVGAAPNLAALMARHAERLFPARWHRELPIRVDRQKARFSSWYELFPRSAASEPGRHGTFRDVQQRLPYVADMGFDVLYLPPIHPIGRVERKGPNNTLNAGPDDVGSPWAIGAEEGGHKAVHPALGTLDDFRDLVRAAERHRVEIALDIAMQCAPDHPYVREHPEWFRKRPDGTIQYAENPPKKYQDIYPFDFETDAWPELWQELLSIFRFWIDQGVTIFRVDNPHTKSLRFWEWCIGELERDHPEVILLSEAFTRPNVMYGLAKRGFTQSYTYFTWKNTSWELRQYFSELTKAPVVEFFRANAWPNTPDILNEYLVHGGRPAHVVRAVLASTLCASWGLYGPVYELVVHTPRPGAEEYVDSEKYQVHHWDLDQPDSLAPLLGRLNRIRRDNPALQHDRTLHFHDCDDERMIAYSKTHEDGNVVLVVASLDPKHAVSGHVTLDLAALGLDPTQGYQVHDLLTDARFLWSGARNYVELDPHDAPAHVFRIRRRVRTELDFEYFL